METKSISRLLSLLELGGQTALVRIYPAGELPTNGAVPSPSGWPQEESSPASSTLSWYAELYIQAGQFQYGVVFSAEGERRYVGEQALNFLGQMGGLSYELLPFPARPNFPPPGSTTTPFPNQPPYPGAYAPPETRRLPPPAETNWGSPRSSSPADSWRPIRTRWGELVVQNAQQLTRDQRRVLALVNGQRSVDEIARLLGFPPEVLSEILASFRNQNLIS